MPLTLYKGKAGAVFYYDHKVNGRRFSGSTGTANRREAEKIEARLKAEHRAQLEAEAAINGPRLTLAQGCAKYWEQKAADHVNREQLLANLEWLQTHFGPNTMLHHIGDQQVANMVAARRKEPNKCFTDPRPIANSTVNATTTKPLQRLLGRARKVWKVETQEIDWREHLLKEPQERVREASVEEEAAILDGLDRGWDDVVQFAIRMGARRAEIVNLKWTDVDWFSHRIKLTGKGSKSRLVPMPPDMRELLLSIKDHHKVYVFTFEPTRTRTYRNGKSYVAGRRYPLTTNMLRFEFTKAKKRAGVVNYRFHDNRHTAATRTLRATGNLRHVQTLLGHAEVKTTTKYAHSTIDDLAAAMSAMEVPNAFSAQKSTKKAQK